MICKFCKKEIPEGSGFCNLCGRKQDKSVHKRGNGQGSVYRRGHVYQAVRTRYVNGERFQTSKSGFKTKREAMEWLSSSPVNAKSRTLSYYFEEWKVTKATKLSDSRVNSLENAWQKLKSVSLQPINSLTVMQLQQIINRYTFGIARDVKSLLSILFKRACAEGVVTSNPAQFLELPEYKQKERKIFSMEDISRFWDYWRKTKDEYAGAALIMIYTGMMPAELMDITLSKIDFDSNKIIGIGKKTSMRKDNPLMFPDAVAPILHELYGNICNNVKRFTYTQTTFRDKFIAMQKKAGITRPLNPYSCRHTTASLLALNPDIAPTTISRAMRHSNTETTERYKHISEQSIKKVLDLIPTK